jgi:hypothetical protein
MLDLNHSAGFGMHHNFKNPVLEKMAAWAEVLDLREAGPDVLNWHYMLIAVLVGYDLAAPNLPRVWPTSAKRVRCRETGKVYLSQTEAAVAMRVAQSAISLQLSGKRAAVQGWTFEIVENPFEVGARRRSMWDEP